jgi:hypothetical protein
VPLTTFQQVVARLLAKDRSADSYLAGGAALHIAPNSLRYSNDLDYFNDSEERVASAFTVDQATLVTAGCTVAVKVERPGFIRAIVSRAADSTKVEWVHDTAWRFLPVVADELAGFCLHPIDLAVNKVLALLGRDEPREFLDTLDVHARILTLGALVWAGAGKDPGFTPTLLLGLLRRRGRYHEEDFSRLRLTAAPDLKKLKQDWLSALEGAEDFISSRPPDEVGCLYYSRALAGFPRQPSEHADVVPHYGRPGGVVPIVG